MVEVNGVPATAGRQIKPGQDRVTLRGKVVRPSRSRTYLMMNKAAGWLSAVTDDRGRPTVIDRLPPSSRRVYPVGRLDRESRGLLLLTDDGDLALRLMHPRYHVEKEYRVRISGRPDVAALRKLREGMTVGAEQFAPVRVRILESSGQASALAMVLQEGRKREVRRLWKALGHSVLDLERVRIGPLQLSRVRPGEVRPLTRAEVDRLRAAVGLKNERERADLDAADDSGGLPPEER